VLYKQLHRAAPSFISQVLQGLQNLLDLGKPPDELFHCITFTKLQAGADFRHSVDKLMEEFGIPTGIVPYKPALKGYDHLIPSTDEIRAALEYKTQRCQGPEIPIIPQCVSKYYCGTTAAIINGDALSPCSRIRYAVKRLKSQRFNEVFNEVRELLLTTALHEKNNLSSTCQICKWNEICWGCRSNAWYYAGDFLAPDPKCWYNKTKENLVNRTCYNKEQDP